MLTSAAITPTAINNLTVRLTTNDATKSVTRHISVTNHPSRVVGFHPQPERYTYKFDSIHPPMAQPSDAAVPVRTPYYSNAMGPEFFPLQ